MTGSTHEGLSLLGDLHDLLLMSVTAEADAYVGVAAANDARLFVELPRLVHLGAGVIERRMDADRVLVESQFGGEVREKDRIGGAELSWVSAHGAAGPEVAFAARSPAGDEIVIPGDA